MAPAGAVAGQVGQHRWQAHARRALQAAPFLGALFSLAGTATLALLLLGRGDLQRLLAPLDRRAVTGDVTGQTVLVGCRGQRLVQAARRRALGELGKGPRKRRLARNRPRPLPAARTSPPAPTRAPSPIARASLPMARSPPRAKGKVGIGWFAGNLITSRGEASSAVLPGCGCANRLYRKVTADASEIGRKSRKISTIPQFCNWLELYSYTCTLRSR